MENRCFKKPVAIFINLAFALTCVLATDQRRKQSMERVSYLSIIMKNELIANQGQCWSGEGALEASRAPHSHHSYSYLLKSPSHGQALGQVPKLLQGMKRPQSLPFREPIFRFGFIHLSPIV